LSVPGTRTCVRTGQRTRNSARTLARRVNGVGQVKKGIRTLEANGRAGAHADRSGESHREGGAYQRPFHYVCPFDGCPVPTGSARRARHPCTGRAWGIQRTDRRTTPRSKRIDCALNSQNQGETGVSALVPEPAKSARTFRIPERPSD